MDLAYWARQFQRCILKVCPTYRAYIKGMLKDKEKVDITCMAKCNLDRGDSNFDTKM